MSNFTKIADTLLKLPIAKNIESTYRYYSENGATPVEFGAHEPEILTENNSDRVAKSTLNLFCRASYFTVEPKANGFVRSGSTGDGVLYTISSVKKDQLGIGYKWVLKRG